MIISASSVKEAILEAEKVYKCDKKQLKVYIIKPPNSKFWGMVKIPGKYKIELINHRNEDLSEQQNKDGYIEIISGKVEVTDPLQEGRYASIVVDDPKIDVYINGKKVFGAAIVTSSDRIEFKATVIEPVTKIEARLSKDKMQAILEINKIPGKKYFVKDEKRRNVVFIRSDYNEIQPPAATLDQCLEELKKLNVDTKFINVEKINELISEPNGGSAVVAEGKRPINGLNSKIKFFFKNTSYRNHDFDTEKKVDLMTHTIIPTVNVGDVLALKVAPAFPGRDGFTVTGEVLKAREGKNIPLKVGKGAVLLDNETKVVAVSPGRPEYKKGVISVVPTLVVPHDVDVGTGNVRFDGDIVIKGNIAENLKVSAGGDITVFGNIYHANVYAKGNIRVHGNIINSKVSAGLNMLNYLGVTPKLKQILEVVKECRSVAKLSEMSKNHVDIRRELLQVVISKKDILDNLMKDIQNLIKLSIDEETNELIRILEDVKRILTGVNAKCIEDSRQIKTLYTEINDYINKIEELYGNEADIIFEYGQNSFIQANGNVVIADKGCYQTNLMAKNAILFKKPSSIVRGGLLIAGKCIKMGIVGTPSGISTYCKVLDRNGKIDAVYYYSNTVLNINDNIKVIDSNFYANRDNK
jgi:hypothetical protein